MLREMLDGSSTDTCGGRIGRRGVVLETSRPHHRQDPRVESLTGIRGLAVLLVVATHATFATGKVTHGYIGLLYSRLEIGVPVFFVLSGFLLFAPWVTAPARGLTPPDVRSYMSRRVRRIMPAYVITVLAAYLLFQFHPSGPNPGQTWSGLLRHLTLTQIYADNYLTTNLQQGLTQMWSLAVEVAFYAALPLLAHLLLLVVCRGAWRPELLLACLAALAAMSPVWLIVVNTTDWLPNSAGMWLPAHLTCFAGGMALSVLREMGARVYAAAVIPLALVSFLVVSTPIAGDATMSSPTLFEPLTKSAFYAFIATLVVAPLALGDRGRYACLLSSRPIVWLGEISYEIFLLHVMLMSIVMGSLLCWPLFTGSAAGLFVVTLAVTVPLAWVLGRGLGQAQRRHIEVE
jgi:peptidoglycan/LPS O-acetylase OafA/YrhL